MKIIFTVLVVLFLMTVGTAFLTFTAVAQEVTPLNLIKTYKNFEIRLGVDQSLGEYITYHYEFN